MRPGDLGEVSVLTKVSRPIEDHYNGLLRGELVRLGYHDTGAVRFEIRGASKPDGAWTFLGGDQKQYLAVFSGKMGTRRQAVNAISTAGEYKWNLKSIAPVAEAFGVTYPEPREQGQFGLYALESPWHPFESHLLRSIPDVAECIRDILDRTPRVSESPEPMMIRLLRSSVEELSTAFDNASVPVLVEELGENSPLVASLRIPSKAVSLSESQARKSAAYVLINQLLFYYILASHPEVGLPQIDPIRVTPGSLHPSYFARVLQIDYRPVFEYDFAKHLTKKTGTPALRSVVRALGHVKASEIRTDVIGKVFHNLIPLDQRKPLGAYFTNSNAADLLAAVAVDGAFDTVMDPACGSGTMLVAAYKRKAELYSRGGRALDEDVHGRFVGQQLTGIDVMPFAAHLATVNLSLRAPRFRLELVRAAIADSLELRPGESVENARAVFRRVAWSGLKRLESFDPDLPPEIEKGGVRGEFRVDRVKTILMNPPFSDSDRIPADYKVGLEGRFGAGPTAGLLHGKYSFQLPFLLLADEFLVPGGKLGAVLPLTTLTGEAFLPWLRWFLINYRVRGVVVGLGRAAFSENTALAECLLLAEKGPWNGGPAPETVIVGAEKSPQDWDAELVRQLADIILHAREERRPGSYSSVVVQQPELEPGIAGIQKLMQRLRPDWASLDKAMDDLIRPVTTTFAELMQAAAIDFAVEPLSSREQPGPHGRGREYYCLEALTFFTSEPHLQRRDDRFVLEQMTKTGWVARDRRTGDTFEVPGYALIPACRRIIGVTRLDASGDLDFVVNKWFGGLGKIIDRVVGEDSPPSAAAPSRETFRRRIQDRWPARVEKGRTRAWMARKLDLAGPGTRVIAAYSDQYPMILGNHWMLKAPDGSEWMEKALVLWLNSTFFIADLLSTRTQTAGSWSRIDKHRLHDIAVPRFDRWDTKDQALLTTFFRKSSVVALPDLRAQLAGGFEWRVKLDDFFLKRFHPKMPKAKREEVIRNLHAGVLSFLGAMKQTIASQDN